MSETASSGRIAILLPDLRGGGAERVCIYLANEFAARGISVDLALMQAVGELLPLVDPRVRVVDLGTPRVRNLLVPLSRYLRRERPAAVLANMWPLTVIVVAVIRLVGSVARVVVVEHNNWTAAIHTHRRLHRMALRWSMRLLLRLADERVGVSGGVARDVENIAGLPMGAVRTVYNPITGIKSVDQASDPLVASCEWSANGQSRIISVGTLKEQKRFDRLLQAFASICNRNARLLILGEGSERKKLEAMTRDLGISERVHMPGFVRNPSEFFRNADLFVLSSAYEGFGNVIVEALAHGIPVVSTDCPSGPSEILENGKYGALVPVGDVDALAKAMDDALSREHDHEALKLRAQDFSVDKAADAYLDLLLPGWQLPGVHSTGENT